MLGAAARFLPAFRNFARQIVPPVVATLLAAVLIAGYNRAFTGHLVQPRMGMMHGDIVGTDEAQRPAGTATVKPREVTDAIVVAEPVSVQNRVFSKDTDREAAKDDVALKTAAVPAAEPAADTTAPAPQPAPAVAQPAPAATPTTPVVRAPAKKAEPRVVERRPVEPRPYGAPVIVSQPPVIVSQPPVIVAPPMAPGPVIATAPVAAPYPVQQQVPYPAQQQAAPYPMQQPIAQEPPPVIAAKPVVTVPDRQRAPYPQAARQSAPYPQNAPYEAAAVPAQEIAPPPPPQGGPLERFVDTMKPSSIFARMRELGDRIEAVGNDILPNIRQ